MCLHTLLSGLLPFFGETEEEVFDMVLHAGEAGLVGLTLHACGWRGSPVAALLLLLLLRLLLPAPVAHQGNRPAGCCRGLQPSSR